MIFQRGWSTTNQRTIQKWLGFTEAEEFWPGKRCCGQNVQVGSGAEEFPRRFRRGATRPGKLTVCYGKIHHAIFMGKSTISMVIFNSYVTNYQRLIFDSPKDAMAASRTCGLFWDTIDPAIVPNWFQILMKFLGISRIGFWGWLRGWLLGRRLSRLARARCGCQWCWETQSTPKNAAWAVPNWKNISVTSPMNQLETKITGPFCFLESALW